MATNVARPRVFLDIQTGALPAGRIVIELFTDKTPRTCENFRTICASSYTPLGTSEPLTYKLCAFHRVIDDFMIQSGDITAGDGTGGQSIYGAEFPDENIGWRKVDAEGILCMANRGKNTNSSQFFITLAPCPHLNNKHTIFGHIITGMDVIKRIAQVPVDKADTPLEPVIITHCGELERRKEPTTASKILNDRGRKRVKAARPSSRSASPSASRSSSISLSSDRRHRKKHHRGTRSPEDSARRFPRRRSDVQIDETRRGRLLPRSPSPTNDSKGKEVREGSHKERRKRSKSPSRSRSRHGSPSPHLRRARTRSRSRAPKAGRQKQVAVEKVSASMDEVSRHGALGNRDSGGGGNRYPEKRDQILLQDKGHSNNGRLGGDGRSAVTGDEVKFKGRGSMKYRERKW